jgi:hypothetical protein
VARQYGIQPPTASINEDPTLKSQIVLPYAITFLDVRTTLQPKPQ